MNETETLYSIALTFVRGLGPAGTTRLLNDFSSAEAIFAASESQLIDSGLRADIARSIAGRDSLRDAERELKYARKNGIAAIASSDELYPPLLRECSDYPAVIYVKGNPESLSRRMLSVVGTRRVTQYGLLMCDKIIGSLAERVPDLCIVSGLAFGVDSAAHRAALRYGVPTVGFIASPLPDITPAQNRDLAENMIEAGGAVVSELNSQTRQNGNLYIPRNRLIAGASAGTIVVESAADGGAMHTASFADGYYRTLLAVPGRATDPLSFGPNLLIRSQKARMVCSAEDVLRELSWDLDRSVKPARESRREELSDAQRGILGCFRDRSSLSADELCSLCAMSTSELAPLLLEMEFSGLLRALPGNVYEKLC